MIPVDVVLKGRFNSIGQYLQGLGKLNNPLNIEGIELNSSKTEKGILEARIRINLFVQI
jgi:Tfp pilus assembly protein PilO